MVEVKGPRFAPPADQIPMVDKSIQQAIAAGEIVGGTIQKNAVITYEGISATADIVVFDSAEAAARYASVTAHGSSLLENLPTLPDGRPYIIFRTKKNMFTGEEVTQSDALASHIGIITDPSHYEPISKKLYEKALAAQAQFEIVMEPSASSGQISGPGPSAPQFAESAQQVLGKGSVVENMSEETATAYMQYVGSTLPHGNVQVGGKTYPVMAVQDVEAQVAGTKFDGQADGIAEKAGYVRVKVSLQAMLTGIPVYNIEVNGQVYQGLEMSFLPGTVGDYYLPAKYLSELGIET